MELPGQPSRLPVGSIGSPSYSLLAESEALLKDSELSNPFLARPLFTATNLANRRRKHTVSPPPESIPPDASAAATTQLGPSRASTSPLRGRLQDEEPVTTTIFPRVKVASFPALVIQAEHQLRSDRRELFQQAHTALQSAASTAAQPSSSSSSTQLAVALDDEDVEIMKSLHNAAVGLASGQSGVREATKRLMIVCREQQEEIDALARKQSEAGVTTAQFASTCHELEERCRATALRVESCATQVNRIEVDVSDALADSRASLRRVLTRLVKTTLMTNTQTASTLSSETRRQLLLRYWRSWARFESLKRVAKSLLYKTERGVLQHVFHSWSRGFVQRRRSLRQRHGLLQSKSLQHLGRITMSTWRKFVERKAAQRSASELLLQGTAHGTRQVFFSKWRRFVARSQKQEALYNGLASLLYSCERSHARGRLSVWIRFFQHRKVQRRNSRMSSLLASNTVSSFRRFIFRTWMRAALQSSARKHLASSMSVSSRKYFVIRFFKRWEEHRRERLFDRRITARVAPLQAALDLALAAAAKNGELVSELLERQISLEAQLLQLAATKVSIRQLRPEAFRGSLIDMENIGSSPSKVVQHIADESISRQPRSTSRPREVHSTEDTPHTTEATPLQARTYDVDHAFASNAPAEPTRGSMATAAPSQNRLGMFATVSSAPAFPHHPQQQGQQSSGTAAVLHHDPLQSLAQHYGVTTPPIKRRTLP